jgi:hypothetical protein
VVISWEHGKKPLGSIKGGEFLDAISRGSDWCLNQADTHITYFYFSGSGGSPDCAGGCPVFVGAVFQEVSQPQPTEKLGILIPWYAAQWTVPLLTGEYTFAVNTWQPCIWSHWNVTTISTSITFCSCSLLRILLFLLGLPFRFWELTNYHEMSMASVPGLTKIFDKFYLLFDISSSYFWVSLIYSDMIFLCWYLLCKFSCFLVYPVLVVRLSQTHTATCLQFLTVGHKVWLCYHSENNVLCISIARSPVSLSFSSNNTLRFSVTVWIITIIYYILKCLAYFLGLW